MESKHIPRLTCRRLIRFSLVLGVIQPLAVGSLQQPTDFSASNDGSPYVGTGIEFLATPGFFTATFDAFPSVLGTLTAFTVRCEIKDQRMGMVAGDAISGEVVVSLGGAFMINGASLKGTGGSNGTGAGPGGELIADFGIPTFEQTLATADSGVTYDPAILATVTGLSPFQLSYTSGVNVGFSNVAQLNANVVANITMTCHYLSAVGGEGETIAVTGIFRNAATGDVTIQ